MTKNNGFKVAALAASIALAMGSTAAFAADPAANALPGQGKVVSGALTAADVTIATGTSDMTIANGAATNVINWGADATATGLNKAGTAGFNVGSSASVDFTGTGTVLNIDSSGNPSQIFGAVSGAGDLFFANQNGIIVGDGGSITTTGDIGLIANTLIGTNGGFDTTSGALSSLNYAGTGGDVTLASGSGVDGATVFVSGGGNVNVDLGALQGGAATFSAGLSQNAVPATTNASANVAITGGTLGGGSVAAISSAGTASNAATVDLSGATMTGVKGVFTNNGDVTLGATNGKVANNGQLTTTGGGTFASLTNVGSYAAGGAIVISSGGNLTNSGEITGATTVTVNEGNIDNSGSIAATSLITQSDSAATGFAAGGQYFINNTGSITSATGLTINANSAKTGGTDNDSTGSFTNTGTLNLGAVGALTATANNNVNLGGTLKAGATPAALSATNPLGAITLTADANSKGTGVLTVGAPLFFGATTTALSGAQVKVMANVTGDKAVASVLNIKGGDAPAGGDYAVRIAGGTTSSAATTNVLGTTKTNTILQGTLAGGTLTFGSAGTPVSDIISGPNGSLSSSGTVNIFFNGRLKTAPYLNNANNFRYNYLPITYTGTAPGGLALNLNPVSYLTNGTSNGKSGVNLLVNGSVTLANTSGGVGQDGAGSAVTGVTNIPNTHIVLQSTGNISTAGYWPGYVYLGTIAKDSSGNALPGTLSTAGKITLTGDFNNVLPGDVAGASGIHFMSGNALVGAVDVTTNANAWINFPTDLLTQSYTAGLITTPTFYAGTATGLIVNYAPYTVGQTEKLFNTHPVDSTK